jgi:hypothetical protein
MIKEIKGYRMLTGYRDQPLADISKLEDMLLAVSDFAGQYPMVRELDLNPVLANRDGAVAVDARVVLENRK